MSKIMVKMVLVVMLIIIFCSLQYGGIDTKPPFQNSWQVWFIGIALAMSVLIFLQEVLVIVRKRGLH